MLELRPILVELPTKTDIMRDGHSMQGYSIDRAITASRGKKKVGTLSPLLVTSCLLACLEVHLMTQRVFSPTRRQSPLRPHSTTRTSTPTPTRAIPRADVGVGVGVVECGHYSV